MSRYREVTDGRRLSRVRRAGVPVHGRPRSSEPSPAVASRCDQHASDYDAAPLEAGRPSAQAEVRETPCDSVGKRVQNVVALRGQAIAASDGGGDLSLRETFEVAAPHEVFPP